MNKLVKIVALLFVVALVCAPCAVFAQDASAATDAVASSSVDLHSLYGIGAGIVLLGAALGIGRIGSSSVESMARQPEVQGRLFTVFILASAFVEALALIGFVVALMMG